jgi:hypothetical protein
MSAVYRGYRGRLGLYPRGGNVGGSPGRIGMDMSQCPRSAKAILPVVVVDVAAIHHDASPCQ